MPGLNFSLGNVNVALSLTYSVTDSFSSLSINTVYSLATSTVTFILISSLNLAEALLTVIFGVSLLTLTPIF